MWQKSSSKNQWGYDEKRILISISALIAVVFVSGFAFYFNKHRDSGYITVPAKVDTIVEAVEASGTVNPVNTVDIGSQVSGMIKDIYVDYNSKVTKGQLLAQIDPSLFQAQVDKARGDLEAARSNKAKIQAMLVYDKKITKDIKDCTKKIMLQKATLTLQKQLTNLIWHRLQQHRAQLIRHRQH